MEYIKTEKSRGRLWKEWLTGPEAADLWEKARQLPLEDHPPLRIMGKLAHMNRSVGFFSTASAGYAYSGQLMASKPPPEWLIDIMGRVNELLGTDFNGILVNYYKDGSETIGAHSDDERFLAKGLEGSVVAALSLGATRLMRFRRKDLTSRFDIDVANGDLMTMEGDFQKEFTHEVPKQMRVKEGRVSLTFRRHLA